MDEQKNPETLEFLTTTRPLEKNLKKISKKDLHFYQTCGIL